LFVSVKSLVSIPDRYAKNPMMILISVAFRKAYRVSIPDRYAKNDMPQSYEPPITTPMAMFQFLIGTLKTEEDGPIDPDPDTVSIPDRYAKNAPMSLSAPTLPPVSIPDRYAKNASSTQVIAYNGYRFCQFQFLIGTLKTWRSPRPTGLLIRVSIPDRYAKNPGCERGS
jgi:hypothetical protein